MNNGQLGNFFTPGVGENPPEANNLQPENNLNEDNWQKALEISAPAGVPTPEELNPTPETPGAQTQTPENTGNSFFESQDKEPQLGQITPIENAISMSHISNQLSYNPINIKTTGDKLEKSSIAEIDSAISKLNQTGDLNNFYDEIRGMTEVNLNNSFNRKLYDQGLNPDITDKNLGAGQALGGDR